MLLLSVSVAVSWCRGKSRGCPGLQETLEDGGVIPSRCPDSSPRETSPCNLGSLNRPLYSRRQSQKRILPQTDPGCFPLSTLGAQESCTLRIHSWSNFDRPWPPLASDEQQPGPAKRLKRHNISRETFKVKVWSELAYLVQNEVESFGCW